MSYRTAWVMTIVSYVLMMALFMSAGMSIWVSFIVTLTGVVTWFSMSQLWGRVGLSNEPGYDFGPGFMRMLVWPTDQYTFTINSTDGILAPTITYELASHRPSVPWATTFYTILGTYKMTNLMGVHPRNMVKVAFVCLIVAMSIGVTMNVLMPGIYGLGITTMRKSYDLMDRFGTVWGLPTPYPIINNVPWIIAGVVFVIVMRLLQARFLWIPDPYMSIVAWAWVGTQFGTVIGALICGILKWLVLRIGGSKLYSERVVPFVGGFILGATLNALIAGALAFAMFQPV